MSATRESRGRTFIVLVIVVLAGFICLHTKSLNLHAKVSELAVTKGWGRPVLTIHSQGAEGNKYGFEGGRVLKIKNTHHLFTSEMVGEPHWVKMRLAHWKSADRVHWQRVGTIAESSGDFTGKDARAALWSPLPVYDPREARWNLFYVAYQAALIPPNDG